MLKAFLALFLALILPATALASVYETPRNNRFGIHIVDETDLVDAATLVNGNGGSWGYVTLVIREDEMNKERWEMAFNKMAELKLTPIVRIATVQYGGVWGKPILTHAEKWADFLGSLPWPTKRRYVVLFNEPNHAYEWGGQVNPQEYAQIARKYWEELKKNSFDFFVLPAGLDAAAPNGNITMDSKDFFEKMASHDPLIFTIFDGWASHSYPNPGFSGNPSQNGKSTIRGFEWEVNFLKKFDLPEKIPVFITETGWRNYPGGQEIIAGYYRQAFSEAWNSPNVWAVTPFLLRYDGGIFKDFSWKIPGSNNYYPFYKEVLGISKTEGSRE